MVVAIDFSLLSFGCLFVFEMGFCWVPRADHGITILFLYFLSAAGILEIQHRTWLLARMPWWHSPLHSLGQAQRRLDHLSDSHFLPCEMKRWVCGLNPHQSCVSRNCPFSDHPLWSSVTEPSSKESCDFNSHFLKDLRILSCVQLPFFCPL